MVRFLGETDFAKGEWCGVELDEPLGKNDGAVAGGRYDNILTNISVYPSPVFFKISVTYYGFFFAFLGISSVCQGMVCLLQRIK